MVNESYYCFYTFRLILLAEKCALGLYNYQGRLMASPRWPNMKLDALKSSMVALSSDALAVRDVGDPKSKKSL